MTTPLRYSADTSAIIEGRKLLPPDIVGFWLEVETLIADGRFFVCEHVMAELSYHKDDSLAWANAQSGLVVPTTRELSDEMFSIMSAHPRILEDGKRRHGADPWVIALAAVREATVVTHEGPGKLKEVKIPDVCEKMGIRCIDIREVARLEGWYFGPSRTTAVPKDDAG